MSYTSTSPLFRSLYDAEEAAFRAHARAHPVDSETRAKLSILHPVCRDEWCMLGELTREEADTPSAALPFVTLPA